MGHGRPREVSFDRHNLLSAMRCDLAGDGRNFASVVPERAHVEATGPRTCRRRHTRGTCVPQIRPGTPRQSRIVPRSRQYDRCHFLHRHVCVRCADHTHDAAQLGCSFNDDHGIRRSERKETTFSARQAHARMHSKYVLLGRGTRVVAPTHTTVHRAVRPA